MFESIVSTQSEITVFSDCKIEFRYDLLPKQSPKTEKDRLWNDKLKRLRENEKKQTITISIAAATYDTEIIIALINQAIQDNEDLQTYRQKTKLVLSNGKNFFREIPKVIDAQGTTAFQLQEEIKSIGISRELAYLLGFVNHPKHGIPFITMNNSSKHALLSTHQRPPDGGIFYYFLYCDLIEYQSIGNQRAPLLRITPAVKNIASNVKSIQFEHSRVLDGLVPLINMQKLHFQAFCQNCRTYIPEILYDTKTGNFTSGVDNCACEICKFLQCACADLCFVKWRNGNSFYLRQKAEILVVVTLDCLLSEANRLLKDLFD